MRHSTPSLRYLLAREPIVEVIRVLAIVAAVLVGGSFGSTNPRVDPADLPDGALDPLVAILSPLPGACFPRRDDIIASISVAAIPPDVHFGYLDEGRRADAAAECVRSHWELRVALAGDEVLRMQLSESEWREGRAYPLVLSGLKLPDREYRLAVELLPPQCSVGEWGAAGQARAVFRVDDRGRCEHDPPDRKDRTATEECKAVRRTEVVNVALGRPTETSSGTGGDAAVDGESFRTPGEEPPAVARVPADVCAGEGAGGGGAYARVGESGAWWAVDLGAGGGGGPGGLSAVIAVDIIGEVSDFLRRPAPAATP